MAIAQPFQFFLETATMLGNKEIDLDSDTLKMTLHNTSITPNRATMKYWSALAASELPTGNGYTQGGYTLTGVTFSPVAAANWPTVRSGSTVYPQGSVVRPSSANGLVYVAASTGTTGSGSPTWPTVVGLSVIDGTVTWVCLGIGATVLKSSGANPSWPLTGSAGPFQLSVLHDHSPASDATRPLVAMADIGSPQTGTGTGFEIIPDALGYGYLPVA